MPAHPHTRPTAPAKGSVEVTLPWWAVALPAVAFAVLLLLILEPSEAHAHASGIGPSLVRFFDAIGESGVRALL